MPRENASQVATNRPRGCMHSVWMSVTIALIAAVAGGLMLLTRSRFVEMFIDFELELPLLTLLVISFPFPLILIVLALATYLIGILPPTEPLRGSANRLSALLCFVLIVLYVVGLFWPLFWLIDGLA